MWWADEPTDNGSSTGALVSVVERLGVDHALSRDVVSAVYSYCRQRHGTTHLSGDYLLYLTIQSAAGMIAQDAADKIVERTLTVEPLKDPMLFRTLSCAADAASTYEAYRRGLVRLVESNLSGRGYVMLIDLKKVVVPPELDGLLFWAPLCLRVSAWLSEWRQSGYDGHIVLIRGVRGRGVPDDELKNYLTGCIETADRENHFIPTELIWND